MLRRSSRFLPIRIEYEPAVSVGRDQLTQRFAMGAAVKVLVTYEHAFWRKAGFSGEVVSSDGPLSVVYDNTSHDERQRTLVFRRLENIRQPVGQVIQCPGFSWVGIGTRHGGF